MSEVSTIYTDSKPPEQGGHPGLRPGRHVEDGMLVERDVAVRLRDGIAIYVDVCRPEDDNVRAPALIAYGPYGKHRGFPPVLGAGADIDPPLPDGTPFEAPVAQYWVGHGYAVIYADPRGTWESDGDATMFSRQEAEDGYDLVEWAGTQPWSNGKVGLSGVSYLAMTQYAIAALRPPRLAAIAPSEGFSDLYRESVLPGGILETQFTANLTTTVGFGRGKSEDLFSEVLQHPFLDDFWTGKTAELGRIEVPALLTCSVGNHGLHTRGTLEAWRRCSSAQKWLDVHGRKEWRYYYAPDNVERQRAFFDHFLKGLDTEVTTWDPVRVEYRDRTETGPIRTETQWPPAHVVSTDLHLDAATGRMDVAPPSRPAAAGYDPTKSPLQPFRHAGDEKAVFTHTFKQDTDLAGHAALRLWAASPGAADLDIFVALDKVGADGQVVRYPFFAYLDDGPLALGWMRATRRELDPELSTPDRPVQAHQRDLPLPDDGPVALDIEIWPFTAHFHAGETLRLTIAGADINRWSPEHFVSGHDLLNNTAPHVLYTDGDHASRLRLPIAHPQ